MAKTLADFKKEFALIQKEVKTGVEEMESLEHNLDTFREHIVEGFNVLGARLAELRAGGRTGDKIDDYIDDGEVKASVRELQQRREAGKAAAIKAEKLHKVDFAALRKRMETLRTSLTAEIAARQKKFSSKLLGINQSVKELVPLQTEVEKYAKGGNPDFTAVASFAGAMPAKQFVNLYADLLAEQLSKTAQQVRLTEEASVVKQRLNDKIMKSAIIRAKAAYKELANQCKLGQTAQKERQVAALSAAKQAGSVALAKINAIVDPYSKIMKDTKVLKVVNESPDKDLINGNTKTLFSLQDAAEQATEQLQARTMKS